MTFGIIEYNCKTFKVCDILKIEKGPNLIMLGEGYKLSNFWLMVILFIFGGLMLVIELMMPGFSVPGIVGIISLIVGIVIGHSVLTASQLAIAIFIVFIVIVIMVVLLYRSATRNGGIFKSLFLHSKAVKEEGYTSSKNLQHMVGKEGVATASLRPSGTGEFDGVKLDVITDGQFIPKGARIKIVNVEGFRIIVEQIEDNIS